MVNYTPNFYDKTAHQWMKRLILGRRYYIEDVIVEHVTHILMSHHVRSPPVIINTVPLPVVRNLLELQLHLPTKQNTRKFNLLGKVFLSFWGCSFSSSGTVRAVFYVKRVRLLAIKSPNFETQKENSCSYLGDQSYFEIDRVYTYDTDFPSSSNI